MHASCSHLTVVAALTAALAVIPVAKADPGVFQSNAQFPVSLTFFDCDGQLVTLEGKIHVVSQIWPTDGGGFHSKAHVNVAGVEGTSPDGTKYRFHDNGQSTFETDSSSLNFERDFVDRYRLTRQGSTLSNDDLVVRATFHIKVENGVVTEFESTFARECK
jgi:hypothetical protein